MEDQSWRELDEPWQRLRWARMRKFETESRENYAHRHEIIAALELKPGMAVADVGAGTGLFTRLFAEKVGPPVWLIWSMAVTYWNSQPGKASCSSFSTCGCGRRRESQGRSGPESPRPTRARPSLRHWAYSAAPLAGRFWTSTFPGRQ